MPSSKKSVRKRAPNNYNLNVFLNCPFDARYKPLFLASIFTILNCGCRPRCALEIMDSGQVRLDKIVDLIGECRFGIHDISQTGLDRVSKLPRFNMPFELGLFLGARRYGPYEQNKKNCLILDHKKYRYQKFLSDISGQDVSAHKHTVEVLITKIRDWLRASLNEGALPGGQEIARRYKRFNKDLPKICKSLRLQVKDLTFSDYATLAATWVSKELEQARRIEKARTKRD